MRFVKRIGLLVLALCIWGASLAGAVWLWEQWNALGVLPASIEWDSGPVASIELPETLRVRWVKPHGAILDASAGRQVSLSVVIPDPGSRADEALRVNAVPPSPTTRVSAGSTTYALYRGTGGFIAVPVGARVIVIGDGKWSDEAMLEVLRGIRLREPTSRPEGEPQPG